MTGRSHSGGRVLATLLVVLLWGAAAHAAPAPPPPRFFNANLPGVDVARLERLLTRMRGVTFRRVVGADMATTVDVERRIGTPLDAGTAGLEADEAMLKAFGFIPPTFDLKACLKSLYGEQVAGMYDPATGWMVVVADNRSAAAMPASVTEALKRARIDLRSLLAIHEMDHALDDQRFDLKNLHRLARQSHSDDVELARQAVVEGSRAGS